MQAQSRKNWLSKTLSWRQHKRRLGGGNAIEHFADDLFSDEIIQVEGQTQTFTHGSAHDLNTHLAKLKREFIGQPTYCYHLAATIVLIRRDYKRQQQVETFYRLWSELTEDLLANLSMRWLVSAGDTFADIGTSERDKAQGMWASLLVNTIKAYEVKDMLQTNAAAFEPDPTKVTRTQKGRVALFDGIAGLAVGTDDTFRNMRWRLEEQTNDPKAYAARIGLEIFERLSEYDTAFAKLRNLHTRKKTAWWQPSRQATCQQQEISKSD